MSREIRILEPGLLTTIQDLGRPGYQAFGMPVSGAMDCYALESGNILLGNSRGCAGIECTLLGPTIEFTEPAWFTLTGGTVQATLDGRQVPCWQACLAPAGSVLALGPVVAGARTYVTIDGGIDTPEVMGSRSTYTIAAVGGIDGRPLVAGDILPLGQGQRPPGSIAEDTVVPVQPDWTWRDYLRPHGDGSTPVTVRVVPGPQDDYFSRESTDVFFSSPYTIGRDSNRMGYRLSGPVLNHTKGADIVSDGTCLGAIQVPAHGQPIVLMADRQTTGGYPKIGCVISVDVPLLAQAQPGQVVRFERVTVEQSHQAYRELHEHLAALERSLMHMGQAREQAVRRFAVTVDGRRYGVVVEQFG